MKEETEKKIIRRPILGILSIFLLFILYRVFTVYTVRSGECRPKTVDPSLRLLTRDERGVPVTYPERIGFPVQQRPLVVMQDVPEGGFFSRMIDFVMMKFNGWFGKWFS